MAGRQREEQRAQLTSRRQRGLVSSTFRTVGLDKPMKAEGPLSSCEDIRSSWRPAGITPSKTGRHKQHREEDWTEIDGEKVTPPPAVCHTTEQRDVGPLDAMMILWLCVSADALRSAMCLLAGHSPPEWRVTRWTLTYISLNVVLF